MFSRYLSSTQTLQILALPLDYTTITLFKLLLAHLQVTYAFIQHIIPVFELNPDSTTFGIPFELYNSYAI